MDNNVFLDEIKIQVISNSFKKKCLRDSTSEQEYKTCIINNIEIYNLLDNYIKSNNLSL